MMAISDLHVYNIRNRKKLKYKLLIIQIFMFLFTKINLIFKIVGIKFTQIKKVYFMVNRSAPLSPPELASGFWIKNRYIYIFIILFKLYFEACYPFMVEKRLFCCEVTILNWLLFPYRGFAGIYILHYFLCTAVRLNSSQLKTITCCQNKFYFYLLLINRMRFRSMTIGRC